MADSLRDQLLKSGLVQKLKVEVTPERVPSRPDYRQGAGRPGQGAGKSHAADSRARDNRSPGHARPGGARSDQPARGNPDRRPGAVRPAPAAAPAKSSEELDLARAYALRARDEKQERERLERVAAEASRLKKERKQKLQQLLAGKALNDAAAEQARHFTHGNKIRRVYCTPEQLVQLNAGELAVVQNTGRYLLVDRATALAVQAIEPDALVLLPDPNAPAEDDIPADLIW